MIGTPVIRHELRKARHIAEAAIAAAEDARAVSPGHAEYLAALTDAAAAAQTAMTHFDTAIRLSEKSQEKPARSGPIGSEDHSSTPTQAASDRASVSTKAS